MLLEGKDLTVGYNKQIIASNINFTINDGDILCIIGENGAGKTTLLKTVLNIIKPISGEIIYAPELKDKRFGYLPQISDIQNDFPATNDEVVISGRINSSRFKFFFNKKDKEIAEKNMEILGISELKNKSFNSLSGGQRQRVLIARAMCATDKIIFLDEPLTGLDPKITKEFYEIVEELHNKGVTIVMISHEMRESIDIATHILVVGKENIFFNKEEFLKSEYSNTYKENKEGK